ncbi:DNA-binding transcriptional LysR family regulator [Alteromonadaceae bacterium 2753L.S.0a.02]|nr:DNA-binding transcriptional LysR family regulator [Alteromonadaceae bacterium 2753L.S.0a.02]
MDKLANMQAFKAVAETGSFAAAGRQMGLATSVISKRVSDLESHLNTLLLQRTTRRLALTDTGYHYLEHVQRLLAELEEVEETLRCHTEQAVGEIRLAAPLSFGVRMLAPVLASFLEAHPQVTIRSELSDRKVHLINEGFDLAIRIGNLSDSNLFARKIAACRRVLCASPTYLKKFGTPQSPAELPGHACLVYTLVQDGISWPFQHKGKRFFQAVQGRLTADNGDLLCKSALEGCGITQLPNFIVDEFIERGELLPLLQEYEEQDFGMFVLYPNRRHLSNRVRLLIDHLAGAF